LELAKEKKSKKKRNKRKYDKLLEYTTIARKERNKRDGYRTGMNLDDEVANPDSTAPAPPKAKKARVVSVCSHPFVAREGTRRLRASTALPIPIV